MEEISGAITLPPPPRQGSFPRSWWWRKEPSSRSPRARSGWCEPRPRQTTTDIPRLGGIGQALASEIEQQPGSRLASRRWVTCSSGGTPTAMTACWQPYGMKAAELVTAGDFGHMALRGDEMTSVPLSEGVKQVDLHYLKIASTFFG